MTVEGKRSIADTVPEVEFIRDFLITALRQKIQNTQQWGVVYKIADGEEYIDRNFDHENVMRFTRQLCETIAALPSDNNIENVEGLKLLARNPKEFHGAVAFITEMIRESDSYFQSQIQNSLFISASAASVPLAITSLISGKQSALHYLPTDEPLIKSLLETHRGFESFWRKAADQTLSALMQNVRTSEGLERQLDVNRFLNVGAYGSNIKGEMARFTSDPNFANYYRTYSHIGKEIESELDGINFYKDSVNVMSTEAISQCVEAKLMRGGDYTPDEMRIAIALRDLHNLQRPGHRSIDIEGLYEKVTNIFQSIAGAGDRSSAALVEMEGDDILAQLVPPLKEMNKAAAQQAGNPLTPRRH